MDELNDMGIEIPKLQKGLKANPSRNIKYKEMLNIKNDCKVLDPGKRGNQGGGMVLKTFLNGFKGGYHIQKHSFMGKHFGCQTCLIKDECRDYPHANGGCAERYQYVAHFYKRGKSEMLPLLKERAIKLEIMAEEMQRQDYANNKGRLLPDTLALMNISNRLALEVQKLEYGTKVNIKQEVTMTDISNKLLNITTAEVIKKEEEENGNSD